MSSSDGSPLAQSCLKAGTDRPRGHDELAALAASPTSCVGARPERTSRVGDLGRTWQSAVGCPRRRRRRAIGDSSSAPFRLVLRAVERGADHARRSMRRCAGLARRRRERVDDSSRSKRRRRSRRGRRPPDRRRCREVRPLEPTSPRRPGPRPARPRPAADHRARAPRRGRQGRRRAPTSPSSPSSTAAAVRRACARALPAASTSSCAAISGAVNGSAWLTLSSATVVAGSSSANFSRHCLARPRISRLVASTMPVNRLSRLVSSAARSPTVLSRKGSSALSARGVRPD